VTTTIAAVHGRRVWDSRGRPTVEVELRLSDGAAGRAIAPAGASTGSGEAVDLRDGNQRLGGHGRDFFTAVAHVPLRHEVLIPGAKLFEVRSAGRRRLAPDMSRRTRNTPLTTLAMASRNGSLRMKRRRT